MKVFNHNCAGIDVGSRSHFVANGQGLDHVKEFGVYAEDLIALRKGLQKKKIKSVALESTGTYWQNLFVVLMNSGIEVVLKSGRFAKTITRKKTDVLDCQWIQKMHALGLLPSSFLPDEQTEKLLTYTRHRSNMIALKADTSHKMAKFLKYLNFRLDVVVRDVTGLTGMKIIADICAGNLDAISLSKYRHFNCRQSEEEIAKALVPNCRADYQFGLKQEYNRYKFYLSQIEECDLEIKDFLDHVITNQENEITDRPKKKPYKRNNINSMKDIDLIIVSYQYFGGVDLFEIPGVSFSTVLSLMSEIGPEGFSRFSTA